MEKKTGLATRVFFMIVFLAIAGFILPVSVKAADKNLSLNNQWHETYITGKQAGQTGQHFWYTFSMPSDGRISLSTQAFRDNTDFIIYSEDKATKYIQWTIYSGSEQSPGNENRETWLKKGTYYLEVSDAEARGFSSESGKARVKASFLASGKTEIEPNNTFEQAKSLSKGTEVKGVILNIDDRYDYYKIVPQSNADIKIRVTCYGAEFGFFLYDSDYNRLQYDDITNGTMESPSVEEYTLEKPVKGKTYYLRISNYYKEGTSWGDVYYAQGCYKLKWTQPESTASTTEKQKATIRPVGPTTKKTTTKPATDDVKIGSTQTVNNNKYVVTAKFNVYYKAPVSKKITVIRIPKSVKIKGKTYKVTSIGNKAFYGCKKLKKVIIKSTIIKIGKYAFYKCKKLKTIRIYSRKLTKKRILTGAFKGIAKKAVFYLPKSKKAAYKKILLKRGATKKMKFKKN